ncbi:hypothetical protein QJ857_gp0413 [Tupanvirus soda lake]|uniref:Glycosyltransferase 2-like domain-containing protein n=2 Tax=Tupanvirus TaxID=2094720 RepID=A0A6N1P3T4_9VIRU|nr:hypothetical protein QJ857_gp0413 [Tupanvirus soda lake]QKU35621.1 hypothetical protein [Tupanvirus soda lake]
MLSVSIVTISQYSRIEFLKILSKCIKNQDYQNIIEWIIVDTSHVGYNKTDEDLSLFVEEINNEKFIKIVYFKSIKETIGGWRNESSLLVSGDIVVCMDDDDYYPPQRVSHAVESLKDKNVLLAGCDKMYFYDIHYKKFYQFNGFGKTHSTNNCFAYWKEYLAKHKYDENTHNAEENSFTNNFTEPMIQLEPDKTILHFSHDTNTYNKKKIIHMNFVLTPDQKYITEKNITIEKFITDNLILNDYQKLFETLSQPHESNYDIVYYLGLSPIWSPLQQDLGGSEQAVKHLTQEWAKKGKKVAVYGNFSWMGNFEGVDYINYEKFKFWDKFKTLILWRYHACFPFLSFDLRADKILLDLHDNIPEHYPFILKNKDKITSWMLKSVFHKEVIEAITGEIIPNTVVIENGIRIEDFSKQTKDSRNPFRMCYCSCYTRGLYRILKNIWPLVYKLEPRAELHIYYGMDLVLNQKFKDEMRILLSQPGVMDHGRQPIEVINREKHMSTFHFYYTDCLAEIDCISIRESLVAGCIPIISNINLFKYRDGIHVKWLPNLSDFNQQIACGIVELLHNIVLQTRLRNEYYKSPTIISWEQCADQWLKYI